MTRYHYFLQLKMDVVEGRLREGRFIGLGISQESSLLFLVLSVLRTLSFFTQVVPKEVPIGMYRYRYRAVPYCTYVLRYRYPYLTCVDKTKFFKQFYTVSYSYDKLICIWIRPRMKKNFMVGFVRKSSEQFSKHFTKSYDKISAQAAECTV